MLSLIAHAYLRKRPELWDQSTFLRITSWSTCDFVPMAEFSAQRSKAIRPPQNGESAVPEVKRADS
jgi:hypothetical protein